MTTLDEVKPSGGDMTNTIEQAIETMKNLRDSMPHTSAGDHAAVILGAAIIHLQDVAAGKPYYAETTFQHPTCSTLYRPA